MKRCFYIHLLILIVSAGLIYSGTLSAPFFFDDEFNIVNNDRLHDLANFWPPYGNRYISYLSFGLNYHFGGLDVTGYHLTNIIIHIINALLVYRLAIITFKTPWVVESLKKERETLALGVASVSSLIFFTHPLQTSAVSYITQRFASLATLCYLLSLVLYAGWRLRTVEGRLTAAGWRKAAYVLALLFAVLAQKTKEISFTLPIILILYEFTFFSTSGFPALRNRIRRLVPFMLTLTIIPLSILAHKAGLGVDSIVDDGTFAAQIDDVLTLSRYDYLLTQARVVVTYVRLLFLPVYQNFDYDYPIFHSFWDWQVLLSSTFLLSIMASAVFLFMRSRKTKNALLLIASSGVLWFFITLSIESSIIPIKDVIFEHRIYLPSVGMVLAFSSALFYGLTRCKDRLGLRPIGMAATIALVLITSLPLGVSAYMRNQKWKHPVNMYEDIVSKSPGKARSHNNLGIVYKDMGLLGKAAQEFEITLRLAPGLIDTHKNLAQTLHLMGEADEAIAEYQVMLRLDPNNAETHYALGNIYSDKSMFDMALEHYREVLRLEQGHVYARNNMANILFLQGRVGEAIEEYKAVLSIQPDHFEARYNLASAFEAANLPDEALGHYSYFLRMAPEEYKPLKDKVRGSMDRLKKELR
jgi:Flp pilus assembly protein TadD